MKLPPIPPIRLLDISQPTRQAMCKLGIGSLPEIADLKPDDLRYLEHREQVLRELLRLCAGWFIRAHWVRGVTIDLHERDAAPEGYLRITEAYCPNERWMIEQAIAQLNGSPWCVVRGEHGTLTLWRKV